MSHVAPAISLTNKQETILTKISSSRSLPKSLITRAQIILYASQGLQNKDISPKVSLSRVMVGVWRKRGSAAQPILLAIENKGEEDTKYKQKIKDVLSDNEKPGVLPKFTAEQVCQILSVACEKPEDSNLPLSHWSRPSLRLEVIKRGIVTNISITQLGRFLK
jgi:putative transposase